jgi:hypothetical protein
MIYYLLFSKQHLHNTIYVRRDLVPLPPDTTTIALLVSFSPITQPEDGPIKGPKRVVVSPILH